MKSWIWTTMIAGCILSLGSCGGDGGGCPGIVCTNCGASGDCNVECQAPEVEFCGAFGYFDDPGLRCAFCAPPDFQP
jgi:hypothetical protein